MYVYETLYSCVSLRPSVIWDAVTNSIEPFGRHQMHSLLRRPTSDKFLWFKNWRLLISIVVFSSSLSIQANSNFTWYHQMWREIRLFNDASISKMICVKTQDMYTVYIIAKDIMVNIWSYGIIRLDAAIYLPDLEFPLSWRRAQRISIFTHSMLSGILINWRSHACIQNGPTSFAHQVRSIHWFRKRATCMPAVPVPEEAISNTNEGPLGLMPFCICRRGNNK